MDSPEMRSHSFVIRIETDSKEKWHGHISHVSDGKRHYFQQLYEVPLFIAPYLKDLGINLNPSWFFWRWFHILVRKRSQSQDHHG